MTDAQLDAHLAALGLARDFTEKAPPPSKNRTVLCRRGNKRFLVKVADGSENVGVLREGSVLERLKPLTSKVGSPLHLPHVSAFVPATGLLVLDWLKGAETLHHLHRRTGEYPRSVAQKVGKGLGYLHRASREAPSRFALADAFREEADLLEHFVRMRPEFYARLSRAGVDLFAEIHADGAALSGLHLLSEQQRREAENCLLHGDLRQANLVRVGRRELSTVVFLDWELSLWGDSARDIGSLLADYVLGWLAPEHPSEILSRSNLATFARALIASYASAREDSFKLDDAFQGRIVRWVGASLLIHLYGITHYEQILDGRGMRVLQHAREMLGAPDKWPALLWGASQ